MKTIKLMSLAVAMVVLLSDCNNAASASKSTAAAPTPAKPASADGNFCFFEAQNRDTTKVNLTIAGDKITGEMVWNPYQKDGAVGMLSGTKNASGEFDLVYEYTIEGNRQSETKIMKIENDQLLIKKGELADLKNDGTMTYKDATKAVFSQKLMAMDCEKK